METLREIYDFNQECIKESADKKTVRYKAPFMTPGKVNKNLRLYPLPVLNQAVEEYSGKIEKGKGFGGSYHPASGKLEIPEVSHTIQKMYLKNGVAYVEGQILTDNEKGKKILSLIKAGSTLGLSARSFGTMKSENGVNTIQPGLKIMGIDFVLDPSEDVAKINQSNIFESAEIEEEKKFDVSLTEFNFIVEKFLEKKFGDKPREEYEKFSDENWQGIADDIEADLKKAGKIIESIEKTEIKMEDFPISEAHFGMAKLSGYRGNLHEFLELKNKSNDPLFKQFQEAQMSGYKGTFDDFKKKSVKK